MLFNTLKVIHIFSIIAWMAGLLYLPRLFVNHANPEITKETSETFKLMEGKLYRIIMFPAFIVTWISGFTLSHYVGIDTWLLLKILFVILLIALFALVASQTLLLVFSAGQAGF
jgi:putative membrane protein